MSIGVAHRKISRAKGECCLAPGYDCVPRTDCASTAFRRFQTEPIFGAMPPTAYDDWERSVLVPLPTMCFWCVFWTTRDGSSCRVLRPATRLRQEQFKIIGAIKSVAVYQLHARFKVTYMNLEARKWLVDVHATTVLECLNTVFWV